MPFDQLHRREVITLLGGAAGWPLAARAQEPGRIYRLGFLLPHAREAPWIVAFFDELRLSGFSSGRAADHVRAGHQSSGREGDRP